MYMLCRYIIAMKICYSPAGRSVLGETVPEVLNTARAVCLKQIITRVINKQIITRVSKKDERIEELDTKAAGKKYAKVFFG